MFRSLVNADTKVINNKHSGKFISNLTNDVSMITNLVSTAILNLFKDSLTLLGLLAVMFYQNWKLSLIAIIMIPLASVAAKSLGKRIGKVTNQQMIKAGALSTYFFEIFKNHLLIKIFQKETYEIIRADKFLKSFKETQKKLQIVFVRASPIMEFLTGLMIAFLIYIAGILVSNNERFLPSLLEAAFPRLSLTFRLLTFLSDPSADKTMNLTTARPFLVNSSSRLTWNVMG